MGCGRFPKIILKWDVMGNSRYTKSRELRTNEGRESMICKALVGEDADDDNFGGEKFLWDEGYLLYNIKI